MQVSGHDTSTSGIVSPTQVDFVRFLQKCASSPHPLRQKEKLSSSHCDGSAFTSPELLADTLLNWDAGARLAGADSSETLSWPALRVQLQQQGFPHDSLPHHMPYSSHADACVRGILGDVLVQYSLRGQLVQQLIDTVEFASMHDSHSSVINGSNASAAHELSRALETNQFRSFEEAAVQRATEQSLRQKVRQAETDLQSSKERNRQLRSQVSDLEEEVHLMTRQLSKLRGNAAPATAPAGNGRWEPPQVPSFKLPSAASSPAHPAVASQTLHNVQALIIENDALKSKMGSLQAMYDELVQGMSRDQSSGDGGGLQRGGGADPMATARSAREALGNESKSDEFAEDMFRLFNVTDSSACRRVAHATVQLAKAVPHLQSFALNVTEACRQYNPVAIMDSPEETMRVLRDMVVRVAELSARLARPNSPVARQQLEHCSALAVESVAPAHAAARHADGSEPSGHAEMFDGSKLVFFTGPNSEDSLATSPLPHASAPAPAPAVSQPCDVLLPVGVAADAVVAEAMDLVGCSRPEELLLCIDRLLAQSDELQHLRAVLSRRLQLTDPSATFVDAELGAIHSHNNAAAESVSIKLRDPDDVLPPDSDIAGGDQQPLPDNAAARTQQSLAWDIVMRPARRPKPKLSPKPTAARSQQVQPTQSRDRDPSRRALSQSRQQRSQLAATGFSQQLFANFKRRLMSQHSAAAAELLSLSRQKQSGAP